MRLTTKVYLATALVTTIGALGVGSGSVLLEYQSSVASMSSALKEDMTFVDPTSIDALEEAITVGQASAERISIAYLDSEGRISLIHDDGPAFDTKPTKQLLVSSTAKPEEFGENLISTLPLGSNDYLIFAASLSDAKANLQANFARLASIYFATLGLLIFLVWLTLRRDLRSIRRINSAALRIAEGDLEASLPDKKGNSEIEALSRSLREMVDRLKAALDAEKRSKATIESFIGDASHELRTPLTVIRGYSELVGSADAKLRKSASEKIIREVDKMSTLVNDLLLLARLGESAPTSFEKIDAGALVEEAAANLGVMNPKLHISTDTKPTMLKTDAELLTRFLANASSNVHRYAGEKASVSFSIKSTKSKIEVRIEDSGPGLPKSAYKEGIRSFKRFDSARSRSAGGTGLGMSIMAGIAENLGGKVRLSQSKLGGLCVLLVLPAK